MRLNQASRGVLLLALFCVGCGQAPSSTANVILVTLDGVRWQEVFHGVDESLLPVPKTGTQSASESIIFKHLVGELGAKGYALGNRKAGEEMVVSNTGLNSLPAYQSIMMGAPTGCQDNGCPRVNHQTFLETIRDRLALKADQVAVFASWDKISLAVAHDESSIFVDAGGPKGLLETKNNLWNETGVRMDSDTVAAAIKYLKNNRPRFLYLSLNDTDEWAHAGNYPEYLAALRRDDEWMAQISTTLQSLGEYGQNTTLIVTTDHGRGSGKSWTDHGAGTVESKYIWLVAYRAGMKALPHTSRVYAHSNIRPTIESLFGVGTTFGDPILEVLEPR